MNYTVIVAATRGSSLFTPVSRVSLTHGGRRVVDKIVLYHFPLKFSLVILCTEPKMSVIELSGSRTLYQFVGTCLRWQ